MKRLSGAFVVAALCGTALRGAGNAVDDAADDRALPELGARQRRADLTRRLAHRLHAAGRQQARGQVGIGAVDRERRRLAAPLPRQGLGRALVARRQAPALPRRGRAERAAALRPLGRRRRPGHADHPRRRGAAQRAVVARRQVDRLLDVRRRSGEVDDQHAGRTEGREVDAGAARRRHDALPAGSGRLPRRRVHASLRRAGRGRHAASADDRQVERRRRRASQRRVDRLDARQQVDRVRRQPGARTPTCSTRPSQLYVVDVATGAIRDLVTKPGSWGKPVVSPDGRTVAFTGYAPSGRSHTVSDLFVIPLSLRRERRHAEDQRRLRSRADQPALGARRHRRLLRRRRSRRAATSQFASIVGGVKPVTTGRHILTFDSVSKDLVAAGTSADPSTIRRTSSATA